MSEPGGSAAPSMQPLSARMAERMAGADLGLLARPDAEAQTARLALLEGATVAVVGVGYPGKRFIYERAAALGVRLVLIDHPGHWGEELVADGTAVAFVPADLYASVQSQVDEILAGLASLDVALDGVCTFWEESVPIAARLARTFALPGNDPDAVDRARSKRLTLVATAAEDIPTPRFETIDPFDPPEQLPTVGYPAVFKPEFGSAAIGVYRVDSEAELRAALDRVEPDLLPLNPDGNFSVYGASFLLEEYLDGTEFDIDLLFWGGRCVYASTSENWPTNEPFFFETGLHAPSGFPDEELEAMIDLSVRGVQALGLELGAFHVEGKITSNGPRIVEINARMGGSIVRDSNLLIHGVDLVQEHLTATVGIPIHPIASDEPLCGIANLLIYADRAGKIASTAFVDLFAADPRVFFAEAHVEAGEVVRSAADGAPTLVVEIALRGRDAGEAARAIRALGASVEIPYA